MTKWGLKLLANQSKNPARIAEVDNNSCMVEKPIKASMCDGFNNWRQGKLELQVYSLIMIHILDGIWQQ